MPIYEYRCLNGHSQDVIDIKREYADVPTKVCSVCGALASKVATAASFGGFTEPKESHVSRAIRNVKAKGL